MALITEITHSPTANPEWKSTATCGYQIAQVDGRIVLHLETYGSAERQVIGKASQYFTFDEPVARELLALLARAFPAALRDLKCSLPPSTQTQR